MKKFKLVANYKPTGDQPQAIESLVKGLNEKKQFQTLLGVTGSGKTFTMANIIERTQRPTLVMAHNKTLAAQLAQEFRSFFPENAVHYFVSYYDYYQPEAYIPQTDTYIEKDASINDEIDKFRHAATSSLLTRRDVIIVASVSCIYGIGDVEDYKELSIVIEKGKRYNRHEFLTKLADMQYERSHMDFKGGQYTVIGDIIEVFAPGDDHVTRLEFFDDELERIVKADHITGEVVEELDKILFFPAKHNATPEWKLEKVYDLIKKELDEREEYLKSIGKPIEAYRIRQRTEFDIEMMKETGYCSGIENYSRYLSGRQEGSRPTVLLDYFPDDFLLFVDESHMTIPQIGGMFAGDRARKVNLIEHGFRLPSALDNRPLQFDEFENFMKSTVFVSATPSEKYELIKSEGEIVEQLIRPTGLLDPTIEIHKTEHQIDDLTNKIKERTEKGERVLITTLTKKSAEDLTDFFDEHGIKVRYLHSEIETIERLQILRDLRLGKFDVLIGINLLREGLDLPEVSLIAILDADKQGFLRSAPALIQTIGRAARNANGHVVMYADKETPAMKEAIEETKRRRAIQEEYNKKHGITPKTIMSEIKELALTQESKTKKNEKKKLSKEEIKRQIAKLEIDMDMYSANLDFEKAAEVRDEIERLKKRE